MYSKMENDDKVFYSDISRNDCEEENNLYDLLKTEPAVPIIHQSHNTNSWEFKPNYEKQYSPKLIKSKLKVCTVSDVRNLFERDVYSYLPSDLEQQQNYLLRKIRDGFSKDKKTKNTAIALLQGDNPISRSAWQMLSNINPENHNHSKQFVLWNGKCVQVNGSRGGKYKFICKHDLKNKVKKPLKSSPLLKYSSHKSRNGLLRNSLNVKFKPGPLGKKKDLDVSHHKYQMGDIELVTLPAPVLEITPAYGTVLEPAIASFITNLREDGVISPKLAEFAVSLLGKLQQNTPQQYSPVQLNEKRSVTFDLNYKCNQNRILMRRDVVETASNANNGNDLDLIKEFKTQPIQMSCEVKTNSNINHSQLEEDISLTHNTEIYEIIKDMLNSVEISLNQESMYSTDNESKDYIEDNSKCLSASKDKIPKRKYCELDKLDVTIIKLPESSKDVCSKPCNKSFCTMGCVCESLDCTLRLKQHCGIVDCMFGCKCEVSKYKNIDFLDQNCSDIIPSLINLDNEISSHMAKEEQMFHQTVILSGEKSILLKPRKRNLKCSNKYSEFYSKMNLKGEEHIKKILTVNIERISCNNIEPLCMVHNLYKCFCKGKFTNSVVFNDIVNNSNMISNTENNKKNDGKETDLESGVRNILRPRLRKTYGNSKIVNVTDDAQKHNYHTNDNEEVVSTCARILSYNGRKHSKEYYAVTNRKILLMEKNDTSLKNKMLRLINGSKVLKPPEPIYIAEQLDCETLSSDSGEPSLNNVENKAKDNIVIPKKTVNLDDESYLFPSTTQTGSFKSWLEVSYKSYKERCGKSVGKHSLEAPKKGKAALQSWDFILSRYRERKNLFFVSRQEPYRTFLAVNGKHPFFVHCKNIDELRFAELPKYPPIIRNLVTNASDSKNTFCILRGLDHCWELIGSAVKVFEHSADNYTVEDKDSMYTDNVMGDSDSLDGNDIWFDLKDTGNSPVGQESPSQDTNENDKNINEVDNSIQIEHDTQSEKSKWFVMTIEKDFSQIQFYKKGFYVTYESIEKSISLARISGKTVRLSLPVREESTQSNSHQYGIYAIPSNSECSVFIGPYEVNEPLGIEVVKSAFAPRSEKVTTGTWVHTNKLENRQVIDNPMAYLPSKPTASEITATTFKAASDNASPKPSVTVTEMNKSKNNSSHSSSVTPIKETQSAEKEISASKQIKPIKIRRTNGFYHLSSNNVLQKITTGDLFVNQKSLFNQQSLLKKTESVTLPRLQNIKSVADISVPGPSASSLNYKKPVAEIAPQVKITHIYSNPNFLNQSQTSQKSKGSGMVILKPEEINNKLLTKPAANNEFTEDIEQFLETSTICIAPQEVLVISDGEDEAATPCNNVWIQCTNVENFGCIRAKINDNNTGISFEFPGFKYSEYTTEPEAFEKINQVLARKMFIPKKFKLQWKVVRHEKHMSCDLLTSKCLEDKKYLYIKLRQQRDRKAKLSTLFSEKTDKKNYDVTEGSSDPTVCEGVTDDEKMKLLEGLEEVSKKLDQQGAVLWKEAVTRRDEIVSSLSVPDNVKIQMSEALNDIRLLNEH